jgi:hypothetical protein
VAVATDIPLDLHCHSEEAARAHRCRIKEEACQQCEVGEDPDELKCPCRSLDTPAIYADPLRALPLRMGEVRVEHNSGEVTAQTSRAPMQLLVQVKGLRLASSAANTTCAIDPQELSGCYSCQRGAMFNFSCTTQHGTALAAVVCSDNTAFTHRCGTNRGENSSITLAFSQAKIDSECTVTCPAGSTTFTLKGRLSYYAPEQWAYDEATGVAVEENSPGEGWLPKGLEMGDWNLDGVKKWLQGLVNGRVLLLGMGLALGAYTLVTCLLRFSPYGAGYRLLRG